MTTEQLILCLICVMLFILLALLLNMRSKLSHFDNTERYDALLQNRTNHLQETINSSITHSPPMECRISAGL